MTYATSRPKPKKRFLGFNDVHPILDQSRFSAPYNNLSQLRKVTQQDAAGGNTVADKRVEFGYNLAGQFASIDRYSDLSGTSNLVASSSYGYDLTGRLSSLTHAKGATTFAGYTLGYDAANRLTSFANSQHTGENATYSYDDAGQLAGADRSGTSNDESYAYDDNGNRETANGATYSTDDNNQLAGDGTFTYTYDDEGNRLTRTRISGAAADDHKTEYEWDYRNRLSQITFKNTSNVITKIVKYTYDAFNRRIATEVDSDGDSDIDTAERYIYDGWNVVLDFVDADGDGAGAAALARRYLYGPAVDQILAQENVAVSTSSADRVDWFLADQQNTTRDLVDNSGAAVTGGHFVYNSFGLVTSGNVALTRYLYTAQEYDSQTGAYLFNLRWYDPATGRWQSEDLIGFNGGSFNLEAYVGNSSPNFVDPQGLADWEWHHLLPQQLEGDFTRAGISNIHDADYGWFIDPKYHDKIHPEWNREWQRFFAANARKRLNPNDIAKQLQKMQKEFDLANHGRQATVSATRWAAMECDLKNAIAEVRKTGKAARVPIITKVGTTLKIIGVIVIAIDVANNGVAVAAEDATNDALWPFLDIARGIAKPVGDLYGTTVEGGILNEKRQEQWILRLQNNPNKCPLPSTANGIRTNGT